MDSNSTTTIRPDRHQDAALVTFSCRAECQSDVVRFLARAEAHEEGVCITRIECKPPYGTPRLEFLSRLAVTELRALMFEADVDTHVMRQTLRACPLAANSLERDWGGE